MSISLATRGMCAGVGAGGAVSAVGPVISDITPSEFSANFHEARVTPYEFDLTGIATGCRVTISVKFELSNEMVVIIDQAGEWQWPFDVVGPDDNSIGTLTIEPVHVRLLPRGGWPRGQHRFVIGAGAIAT